MIKSNNSSIVVGLALALGALMGCADLQGDDQQVVDDVASAEETQIAEQRAPSNSGPLSGDNIKIESVSASGSGCPAGSYTAEVLPEGNALTITFEKYIIEAPPTTTSTLKRLACNLSFRLRTPKNLSYAVASFQYFGYANLAAGMKGSLTANYAWTGFGVNNTYKPYTYNFPVPFDNTYALNDDVVARGSSLYWAPCNLTSNLQVRTQTVLESSSRDRPGVLAVDNVDLRTQAALKIYFRTGPCPAPAPAP